LQPAFHVVIPARFGASRLPGKPLADIAGRPLIQWVWERARASGAATVVIATDDERILSAAGAFGADCMMTAATHASGTDRVAEVVRSRGWGAMDIVVNLQGDEPLVEPDLVARLAAVLQQHPEADIATPVAPVQSLAEFLDPNCVKAVGRADGRALYFSRAPIPWPRDAAVGGQPSQHAGAWRHIGLYAYRVQSLLRFAAWPPAELEIVERLEQLRALERGMTIQLLELEQAPPIGVDTPEDLAKLRALLAAGHRCYLTL
jgi:3-deoxy-manno-octulosonate cytidylyltransferase (CMP-KDO synthetase)